MDFNNKIENILKNIDFKNKLRNAGIYPILGPTGPCGKGLEIKGEYNSLDELLLHHKTGNTGDSYLIEGVIYIWDSEKNKWLSGGNIKGPKGESEKIIINNTTTGDAGSLASVIDTKDGLTHILDFVIPKGYDGEKGDIGPTGPKGDKGEKGDIGPQGIQGPTGPMAEVLDTNYEAIFFASFQQAHYSQIIPIQDNINIPSVNDIFEKTIDTVFTIKKSGYYEITLCGQISGVDQSHGAIFYLSDDSGKVIQDLSFNLKAGSTTRMDCSETTITKIELPTNLYVRCGVDGDSSSSNVDFANINLIIKKYNMEI